MNTWDRRGGLAFLLLLVLASADATITYNAGTNMITCTNEAGLTASAIHAGVGTPTTENIGSWYQFNAKIFLVNSHWSDLQKAIEIKPTAAGAPLDGDSDSSITFGELAGGFPRKGCYLKLDSTAGVSIDWDCESNFYDCIFEIISITSIDTRAKADWNKVLLMTGAYVRNEHADSNFKDLKVQGGTFGFGIIKNFVSNVGLEAYHNSQAGAFASGNSDANTVYKLFTPILHANTYDLTTSGNGRNFYVIEPEWDKKVNYRGHSDAHIWIGMRFRVNVVKSNGDAVVDAEVELKDKHDQLVSCVDSETNLNEALDASETGVNVVDGTKFSVGNVIKIANEWMRVTGIASNTLTVTRGYYTDYPALTHANGVDIFIASSMLTGADGKHTEIEVIVNDGWSGTVYPQTDYNDYTLKVSKGGSETEYPIKIDHRILDDLVLFPEATASYDNIMDSINEVNNTLNPTTTIPPLTSKRKMILPVWIAIIILSVCFTLAALLLPTPKNMIPHIIAGLLWFLAGFSSGSIHEIVTLNYSDYLREFHFPYLVILFTLFGATHLLYALKSIWEIVEEETKKTLN